MALAALPIGALLVATTVGVHAERIRGLDGPTTVELFKAIEVGLQEGGRTAVIDGAPPSLVDLGATVSLARSLGTDEILVFSVFAGASTLRIVAERFLADGRSFGRIERDRALDDWRAATAAVVAELFTPLAPEGARLADAPTPPRPTPLAAWAFAGAGTTLIGAGLVMVIGSAGTRGAVADEKDYTPGGAQRLDDAVGRDLLGATFVVGGVLALVTGVLFAVLDE